MSVPQQCPFIKSGRCSACSFTDDTIFPPAPAELAEKFAPATHLLEEWREYTLICPGADRLRVGHNEKEPITKGVFRLRVENYLGLITIQPLAGGKPLIPTICAEVLSAKFPCPHEHLRFLGTLLDDLFARTARLPFTFEAPTQRAVTESLRPPGPVFTLHFLCHHAEVLRAALAMVLAEPHRKLYDRDKLADLAEATECNADTVLSILSNTSELVYAPSFTLAQQLGGLAPRRVWQRWPEETFDTAENRFVRHFLSQLLTAGDQLFRQEWWANVASDRQRTVSELLSGIGQVLCHPMFVEVGPMQRFPSASHVLLRRDGYREMLKLWQLFHLGRRPLFERLSQAIDVRDIATLYEIWVFFALVEEVAELLGQSPVIDLQSSDKYGLQWLSEARFGSAGRLIYNKCFQRPKSYSVPLRPDFTWSRSDKPCVVLDAKFRLERLVPQGAEEDDTPAATARRADLYKMHTYRDALGVQAAVAVYPGESSEFYDYQSGIRDDVSLKAILFGDFSGIGAIARRPGS